MNQVFIGWWKAANIRELLLWCPTEVRESIFKHLSLQDLRNLKKACGSSRIKPADFKNQLHDRLSLMNQLTRKLATNMTNVTDIIFIENCNTPRTLRVDIRLAMDWNRVTNKLTYSINNTGIEKLPFTCFTFLNPKDYDKMSSNEILEKIIHRNSTSLIEVRVEN